MCEPVITAIALGSNLGDRHAHLDHAIRRLRAVFDDLRASSFYETAPVDMAGTDPMFLNAAVVGRTQLSPYALLQLLNTIENERARKRPYRNASRTLDLDIVMYGNSILKESDLVIPHPRFRGRRFVLEPLMEIAPTMRDPETGLTVTELLAVLAS